MEVSFENGQSSKDFSSIMQDLDLSNKQNLKKNRLPAVRACIRSKNSYRLPTLVCNEESIKSESFWDICTEICQQISQKNFESNEEFFYTCEVCLNYLVENSNEKEMFYVVLEHMRASTDQLAYDMFMNSANKILLKMSEKLRSLSCDTLLSAAWVYIDRLPLPKPNLNLEGDERKLIANDPKVCAIGDALKTFLRSVDVFMKCENFLSMKETILQYMFCTLEKKLLYIHVGHFDCDKEKLPFAYCHKPAGQIINYISKFCPDFYKFTKQLLSICSKAALRLANSENSPLKMAEGNSDLENTTDDDGTDNTPDLESYSYFSVGCFLYLTLGELVNIDNWPVMLDNLHILQLTLPTIVALLSKSEDLVIYKGIYLAEAMLSKLSRNSLSEELLDDRNFNVIIDCFINVMLHCIVVEYRQRCLKLLGDYIWRFNSGGRYKIYYHIVKTCSHSGVIGHIIGLIKEEINANLNEAVFNDTFGGEKLERLVVSALTLPDDVSMDLLKESDRIIAGLNLIRFLAIRIPVDDDSVGFWLKVKDIEELFLEPLKNGLQHSRMNYKIELKKALEGQTKKEKGEPNVEVTIGDTVVPPHLQGRHVDIIEGGLRMFDLMESLHARVDELINIKKRLITPE